jgi:hypothetical protein
MLLACDTQMNCAIWDAGTGNLLLDLSLTDSWQASYQVLLAGNGTVLRLGNQEGRGVCCAHTSLNAVPSGRVLGAFDLHLTGEAHTLSTFNIDQVNRVHALFPLSAASSVSETKNCLP